MQNNSRIRSAFAVFFLIFGVSVSAAQTVQAPTASTSLSYTATAIHGLPGQPETTGKIIKSGQNMRLEFDQNGQQTVQILRPSDGVMYILDPQNNTYIEIRGQSVPSLTTEGYTTPCPASAQMARCERVGADTVSGIKVERWEMANQPNTRPIVILWDSTRRRALRQEFPDGSVMAMTFKAMEELNSRDTEHWTITINTPNQPANTGGWWFDPELRVVVREDLPGGEIRRLDEITVGPVDPALFQVPDGWAKQDAPPPASE